MAQDISQDVFRSRLRTAIEGLRYWIPSVADAARVEEVEAPGYWKLKVTPRTPGACPLELVLRADQRFDIVIGGETYEDLELIPFEDFVPLIDAITAGNVIQRCLTRPATGAPIEVSTLVTFADGRTWSGTRRIGPPLPAGRPADDDVQRQDRHFLHYRR